MLIVKNGIRGIICLPIIDRWMLTRNTWRIKLKKETSYLKYCDMDNLYGWTISQKLSKDGFKLVEETWQFKEDFIKTFNEDRKIGYIFEINI